MSLKPLILINLRAKRSKLLKVQPHNHLMCLIFSIVWITNLKVLVDSQLAVRVHYMARQLNKILKISSVRLELLLLIAILNSINYHLHHMLNPHFRTTLLQEYLIHLEHHNKKYLLQNKHQHLMQDGIMICQIFLILEQTINKSKTPKQIVDSQILVEHQIPLNINLQ